MLHARTVRVVRCFAAAGAPAQCGGSTSRWCPPQHAPRVGPCGRRRPSWWLTRGTRLDRPSYLTIWSGQQAVGAGSGRCTGACRRRRRTGTHASTCRGAGTLADGAIPNDLVWGGDLHRPAEPGGFPPSTRPGQGEACASFRSRRLTPAAPDAAGAAIIRVVRGAGEPAR
jgi:hypothetical protein